MLAAVALLKGSVTRSDGEALGIDREYLKNRALPALVAAGILRKDEDEDPRRRWYAQYYPSDDLIQTLQRVIVPRSPRGTLFISYPSSTAFKAANIETWSKENLEKYKEELETWWRFATGTDGSNPAPDTAPIETRTETRAEEGSSLRQRVRLEALKMQQEGLKPTTRKIAERLGIPRMTVFRALKEIRQAEGKRKPSCPYCHSTNVRKWTPRRTKAGLKQRYFCNACRKAFTPPPSPSPLQALPA